MASFLVARAGFGLISPSDWSTALFFPLYRASSRLESPGCRGLYYFSSGLCPPCILILFCDFFLLFCFVLSCFIFPSSKAGVDQFLYTNNRQTRTTSTIIVIIIIRHSVAIVRNKSTASLPGPRDMDTSGSFVYNLQPDQFPVDQGTEQQQSYITKRTTTSPSVSHGMLQDDLYRCDPCPSSVENWTGSSSGSVISAQHPWGLGTLSQRFTLSPSFSPQNLSPPSGGNVHPLSFYDADHLFYHHDAANVSPSMTTKPDPTPVKLEAFSPLEGYHDSSSSDWTCDVDFDVPGGFEPESFCRPLDIPASLEPSVLTNTSSSSVSSKTTTTTTPTLSPPTLSGSSCDQQSPTTVKIEPAREDLRSYPADNVHVPYEDQNAESPYSKLIEQALLSTPDKKLPLQGIYDWFEKNTAKGREGSKGWQNSIRHNLSMNAVCSLFFIYLFIFFCFF